jgi:hypothetical protein
MRFLLRIYQALAIPEGLIINLPAANKYSGDCFRSQMLASLLLLRIRRCQTSVEYFRLWLSIVIADMPEGYSQAHLQNMRIAMM